MSNDVKQFYKLLKHLIIHEANGVARERAVRLYKSSPETWGLQLRGPLGLGFPDLHDGKDFIIASASLELDELKAVRDACDAEIRRYEANPAVPNPWRNRLEELAAKIGGVDGGVCRDMGRAIPLTADEATFRIALLATGWDDAFIEREVTVVCERLAQG